MTRQRDDIAGLEATIIMSPQIWKASGHVDTFSDPMVDCKGCNKRFRADQVEPQSGTVYQYNGAEDGSYDFWRQTLINSEKVKKMIPAEELETAIKNSEGRRPGASLVAIIQKYLLPSSDVELTSLGHNFIKATQSSPKSNDSFAFMLLPGKPPEAAEKMAKQFYERRGIAHPKFLEVAKEKFEDISNFCNECGSILTDP